MKYYIITSTPPQGGFYSLSVSSKKLARLALRELEKQQYTNVRCYKYGYKVHTSKDTLINDISQESHNVFHHQGC